MTSLKNKSLLVGLTGGIGCGKTEVARMFKELGAKIIDADAIGKKVVEKNAGVRIAIKNIFGSQFMNSDGKLKRKELGSFVFADEKQKKKLNDIVHPHLLIRIKKEVASAKRENREIIVVDAALIYEAGLEKIFDLVIAVYAELKQRIARIQKRDNLPDQEILNRIQSQMPLDEKVKRADRVVTNDGTLAELRSQVETLFQSLRNSHHGEPSKIALLKKK